MKYRWRGCCVLAAASINKAAEDFEQGLAQVH
jgi:hypothetical protein